MNGPLEADDVSKHTTPNAVREASDDQLDHIYNCAVGHLRHADPAVVKQMEQSVRAILLERAIRRARWPFRITVIALCLAAVSVVINVINVLRNDLTTRVESLERRVGAADAAAPTAEVESTITPEPSRPVPSTPSPP